MFREVASCYFATPKPDSKTRKDDVHSFKWLWKSGIWATKVSLHISQILQLYGFMPIFLTNWTLTTWGQVLLTLKMKVILWKCLILCFYLQSAVTEIKNRCSKVTWWCFKVTKEEVTVWTVYKSAATLMRCSITIQVN